MLKVDPKPYEESFDLDQNNAKPPNSQNRVRYNFNDILKHDTVKCVYKDCVYMGKTTAILRFWLFSTRRCVYKDKKHSLKCIKLNVSKMTFVIKNHNIVAHIHI